MPHMPHSLSLTLLLLILFPTFRCLSPSNTTFLFSPLLLPLFLRNFSRLLTTSLAGMLPLLLSLWSTLAHFPSFHALLISSPSRWANILIRFLYTVSRPP